MKSVTSLEAALIEQTQQGSEIMNIMEDLDRKAREATNKIYAFLNANEPRCKDDAFRRFASNVMDEFNNVADYIWKTPKFIERETALEIEKLAAYFRLRVIQNATNLQSNCASHVGRTSIRSYFTYFPL